MNKDENKKVLATGFSSSKGLEKPVEKVDKKYGFMTWGEKNDYPFYLIDMYNGSAWHQGILKTKTYYIAGGGLEVVNGQLDEFLLNKNTDFTIDEIAKEMAFDGEMFDSFCVIGTWNKEGTRVAKWEYYERDKVRTNSNESMYFTSDDWAQKKQSEEKTNYREILPLDMSKRVGKFLMCYNAPSKQAKGEKGVYPKPNYVGGLTAINTDVLISQYHLFEIQNGFKGGTLINLANGQPESEEEARAHRDNIKGDTTNIEDTNEVIITFSDGGDNAPTVLSLNGNDLADRYNMTEKSVQQNILVAHGATNPVMFGINQEGSFNAAESQELFAIFNSVYVNSRQETLEYFINKMAELSGFEGELRFKEVNPFKQAETTVEAKKEEAFRSADADLKVFKQYGQPKDKFKSVRRKSVPNEFNSSDVAKMEGNNYSGFFDKIGDIRATLTDLDKRVLDLLRQGEDGTSIQSALDEPLYEVAKSINKLENANLIVDGETSSLGDDVLEGLDIDVEAFEVRYSYEVKAGFGSEIISTTRPFCETLINQNRLYLRSEIDIISGRIQRDVWRYRGGFYHNPNTDRTTPWCRHEWVQHLVTKK